MAARTVRQMRAGKSAGRPEQRPRKGKARVCERLVNQSLPKMREGVWERQKERKREKMRGEERRQCCSKTQCSAAVIYLCEDEAIS